jgi:hypothetical protein
MTLWTAGWTPRRPRAPAPAAAWARAARAAPRAPTRMAAAWRASARTRTCPSRTLRRRRTRRRSSRPCPMRRTPRRRRATRPRRARRGAERACLHGLCVCPCLTRSCCPAAARAQARGEAPEEGHPARRHRPHGRRAGCAARLLPSYPRRLTALSPMPSCSLRCVRDAELTGEVIREWLSSVDDITHARPKVRMALRCCCAGLCVTRTQAHPSLARSLRAQFGDAPLPGRLGARLDALMQVPSILLLDPDEEVLGACTVATSAAAHLASGVLMPKHAHPPAQASARARSAMRWRRCSRAKARRRAAATRRTQPPLRQRPPRRRRRPLP